MMDPRNPWRRPWCLRCDHPVDTIEIVAYEIPDVFKIQTTCHDERAVAFVPFADLLEGAQRSHEWVEWWEGR
jgi:hypothetical protein